ncbi:MAG: hypothetical protein HY590_05610 [Candidatus Omnitrophica bacterium]|nr:hypothetical protein [Candidatus Omnitrophota bacterium]
MLGGLLILIGIAGTVLPILPGLLFLFLGLSFIWPSKAKALLTKARSEMASFRDRWKKR